MVLAAIQITGCCLIRIFPFSSLGLLDAKSDIQNDTKTIALLKRYSYENCPQRGFPLVFVCDVMSTASRPHEARMGPTCAAYPPYLAITRM